MKADCLGKPLIATKNPEGAAIGAAMLASVAEGNFANLDEAAEAMVELGATYEPNLSLKPAYDEVYQRYYELYFTMEPFFNKFYKA
jgi:xylulokinase